VDELVHTETAVVITLVPTAAHRDGPVIELEAPAPPTGGGVDDRCADEPVRGLLQGSHRLARAGVGRVAVRAAPQCAVVRTHEAPAVPVASVRGDRVRFLT